MAVIKPNAEAPDTTVHYALSSADFDLGPGDTFESDDPQVIADVNVHPWLTVAADKVKPEPVAQTPAEVYNAPTKSDAPAPASNTADKRVSKEI